MSNTLLLILLYNILSENFNPSQLNIRQEQHTTHNTTKSSNITPNGGHVGFDVLCLQVQIPRNFTRRIRVTTTSSELHSLQLVDLQVGETVAKDGEMFDPVQPFGNICETDEKSTEEHHEREK